MEINRVWAMPNSSTFRIKPINELIKKHKDGRHLIVDPFCRDSPFKEICISNDIDPAIKTDYTMDALDFLKTFDDNSVDLLFFDPPYSPRQVSECYKKLDMTVNMQTTQSSFWGNLKKEITRIVKPQGRVITFGWNSGGIGKTAGFKQVEILLVPHGGWHNDTICTVEEKCL